MKRTLLLLVMATFLAGCTEFDETDLLKRVDQVENRIKTLETLCSQLNTNISSLQSLVASVQKQDYILQVTPLVQNGKEIGYTITFAKGEPVIIYNAADGSDGADGHVPEIGARKDADGSYYWTLEGEWLLDDSGNKIKAGVQDGVVPRLKVEDGYWYVSYDNEETWTRLASVDEFEGEDGDGMIREIREDEDGMVVIVLSDGTEMAYPKLQPMVLSFDEEGMVAAGPYGTVSVGFTVTGNADDIAVELLVSGGVKAKVNMEGKTAGTIQAEMGGTVDEYCKVIVLVSDGMRTITRTILFEETRVEIAEESETMFKADGGEVKLEYMSNTECEVIVPDKVDWITVVSSKAMDRHEIVLSLKKNTGASRSADLILRTGGKDFVYTIVQRATRKIEQREILEEFYRVTNGDNWTNNENWCTDKPLNEWYGVNADEYDNVYGLLLINNNLFGDFPECITRLDLLSDLCLANNKLMGEIPNSIGNLKNLFQIVIGGNPLNSRFPEGVTELEDLQYLSIGSAGLHGSLPPSIGNMKNLRSLYLSGNNLTGSIPAELAEIMDAEEVNLIFNKFTGRIPEEVAAHSNWKIHWPGIMMQMGPEPMDFSDLFIPAPDFCVDDLKGKPIDTEEYYSEEGYTIIFRMSWFLDSTKAMMEDFLYLYDDLLENNVRLIGFDDGWYIDTMEEMCDNMKIPWQNMIHRLYPGQDWDLFAVVIDNEKRQIKRALIEGDLTSKDQLFEYIEEISGVSIRELYESSDYSRDGKVTQLQAAGRGNGIDLVMMGDAYSDRLIADGTYSARIADAVDDFFSEEPYKSYRDFFNVYQVDVVSPNEIYRENSITALGTGYGAGTEVFGNDQKVMDYARKALSDEEMDEAMVIVLMNRDYYAGTCYMYGPSDMNCDYGSGFSISYFPTSSAKETFRGLVLHEAGGHGFGKLGDEYAYDYMGTIPHEVMDSYKNQMPYGWWRNVDFTSDVKEVQWNKFIFDSRYADEGLGAFEGGLTYWKGVWRPTDYSIMRENTQGYNAPSREAIYYRLHKLAYGPEWEYDYEEFVEYDAVNRNKAKTKSGRPNYVEKADRFVPPAPPVVMGHAWNEHKN